MRSWGAPPEGAWLAREERGWWPVKPACPGSTRDGPRFRARICLLVGFGGQYNQVDTMPTELAECRHCRGKVT